MPCFLVFASRGKELGNDIWLYFILALRDGTQVFLALKGNIKDQDEEEGGREGEGGEFLRLLSVLNKQMITIYYYSYLTIKTPVSFSTCRTWRDQRPNMYLVANSGQALY